MSSTANAALAGEKDNIQAFYDLLTKIENCSSDPKDKGTRFENLSLAFFRNDPEYQGVFTKVQTFKDWAQEHEDLWQNAKDIGIDLVATNALKEESEEPSYTAIQCKFYAKDASIPKSGIDSFLASSSKSFFAQRIIIATNSNWSDNLVSTLQQQTPPVAIIDREKLANSAIDWSQFDKDESIVLHKRQLRPYQVEALNNVISGFKAYERGKLIMACGTGKTFTSLKIAEKQTNNNGFVLFLVPSLALLSQTLSDWKQQSEFPIRAFAVCSDVTVGKKTKSDDTESLLSANELSYPATTNAEALKKQIDFAFAQKERHQETGMVVVFSTYQSIEVLAVAQNTLNLRPFDLVICDEAHRTAGGYLVNPEIAAHYEAANLSLKVGDTPIAQTIADNEAGDDSKSKTVAKKTKARKSKLDFIDDEEAVFTRIHNDQYIHAAKRLYMTATPKIYGEAAQKQAEQGEAILYSMDDEATFGPVFHTLNFNDAVNLGCLVDYKVIVLVTDPLAVSTADDLDKLNGDHIGRIIGSWKALNKYGTAEELRDDAAPMKRAVGFAQVIEQDKKKVKVASKLFASEFEKCVDHYRNYILNEEDAHPSAFKLSEQEYVKDHSLYCDCEHIDGSMNATEKGALLQWLREEPEENHCKILFNVRCLSEGVDVPALDAVIFLSPRKSQVEVVQTVGRVMRRAPGKKRGYVILPITCNGASDSEQLLESAILRSENFNTVWQVLRALKSINPDHVLVDGMLEKIDERIEVICINHNAIKGKSTNVANREPGSDEFALSTGHIVAPDDRPGSQGELFSAENFIKMEESIKSAIIKKIGNRREWEDWAEDVGKICQNQVDFIKHKLDNNDNGQLIYEFKDFKDQLSCSINGHKDKDAESSLSDDEVIEMLAQHIVIKPVLDELFKGYPFTEHNPIARALTNMLEKFDSEGLQKANKELDYFYKSVGARMKGVQSLADRQKVIVDLFDRFFKVAFPKQQEKLGIVYTPIEVVDFINHSVNDILKKEFNQSFANPGVHVLDPFTGTGTFITRLMQSEDLIPKDALPYKYFNELHAFELMPLAYYVASINMESVYQEFFPNSPYIPNNITVLTNTFALHDEHIAPLFKDTIAQNTNRRKQVDELDIRVIIGNPPYSAGQTNANDDNKNDRYLSAQGVDTRIQVTYVEQAGKITNKNSLYDSYIKAFRWASDKLGDKGVIAFVTNAGWLDSAAANGMRKCLKEEFSSIYVYHLKGNQRTSGEQSRKEGGKIFGAGSRAPIAITILVKNPEATEQGKIYFACVDDYLSREEKLALLSSLGSVLKAPLDEIIPDSHNDWLNQRRDDFDKFIPVDGKKNDGLALFGNYSLGIVTSRDSWSYNSSQKIIEDNFVRCISFYNSQVEQRIALGDSFVRDNDPIKIKWDRPQIKHLEQAKAYPIVDASKIVYSLYRPFFKQFLYNDSKWINCVHQMPKLFPYSGAENLVIGITGLGAKEFSSLISNSIPCFDCVEKAQWLPRYVYREVEAGNLLDMGNAVNGYVREDGINEAALKHFKDAYPEHAEAIDVDAVFYYIYGILHSKDYRSTYANNLQKELARIPRVATYEDFVAFEKAGRALADLHVNYESVELYQGCTFEPQVEISYRVDKLSYGKIPGKTGNAAKDKTTIIFNDTLTIRDIPLEAQEYVVNKKSALDWVVERCGVSIDKDSQIKNDFNDYAKAVGDEKYIFNLILRVITVSLQTNKIVKALPKLKIHPLDIPQK